MTDIQRYEIEMDHEDGYDSYWTSVPCDSGEWVKWDDVQALLAERDALRADAERYRWLRNGNTNAQGDEMLDHRACSIAENTCGSTWDKAIDAARAALVEGDKSA